jgi:hypothetical protein
MLTNVYNRPSTCLKVWWIQIKRNGSLLVLGAALGQPKFVNKLFLTRSVVGLHQTAANITLTRFKKLGVGDQCLLDKVKVSPNLLGPKGNQYKLQAQAQSQSPSFVLKLDLR